MAPRRASRARPPTRSERLAAQTVPVAVLSASAPSPAGRRAALAMVATALLWALATWVGGALGLSQRTRALLDLFALAGFGLALYLTWQAWRARRASDAE